MIVQLAESDVVASDSRGEAKAIAALRGPVVHNLMFCAYHHHVCTHRSRMASGACILY